MSSSAAKKPSEPLLENPDLPSEREQRLSRNFEDPALEELIPGLHGDHDSPAGENGLMQETLAAVQELVIDASGNRSAPEEFAQNLDFGSVPNLLEGNSQPMMERWLMAEELFQLVACNKPFDLMVEEVLRALVVALGAQVGSILELDQEKREFFFRASFGGERNENVKAFRVPANKGIVGHVAESLQPLLLRDLSTDSLQLKAISLSVGFDATTGMAAPIVIGNQFYGVIEVFNRKDGGSFAESDLRVLEEGVRMAAKVLEVRFLMAELVRRGR